MARLSVDHYGPWEIGRTAVSFGIEIIAPSADGLGKGDSRDAEIHQVQRTDFPEPAEKGGNAKPYQKTAVNSQSARPDIYYLEEITCVTVPVEYDVICPGADYGGGDTDDHEIKDLIACKPM